MGLFLNAVLNYFKTMSIQGVINWILIIGIAYFVIKDYKRDLDYERALEQAQRDSAKKDTSSVSIEAKKIAEEVNQKGDTVVIFEKAEPIIKFMELRVEDRKRVDSILQVNEIEKKHTKAFSTMYAEAKAENLVLKQLLSSKDSKDTVYQFKDKYIVNSIYKRDSGYISNVWLDATVNRIDYEEKRKFLFGGNQNLAKVYFNSPYIKPTGMDYFEFKQPEKFFDIEALVEGRYIHNSKDLSIGPRLDIKLGRFKVIGGYAVDFKKVNNSSFWYGGSYKIY